MAGTMLAVQSISFPTCFLSLYKISMYKGTHAFFFPNKNRIVTHILRLDFFFFFFWPPPRHMEFPGQGSDLSCRCNLCCSNTSSFNPLCQARDQTCVLVPPIPLRHSGNSYCSLILWVHCSHLTNLQFLDN